jgi:hypothetical protein
MDYISINEAPVAINYSRDFDASHLWGRNITTDSLVLPGRLPVEWVARFREDFNNHLITYVIFSWSTPIGWVLGTGEAFVPEVRYSPTTTRHQNVVRNALKTYKTSPHA